MAGARTRELARGETVRIPMPASRAEAPPRRGRRGRTPPRPPHRARRRGRGRSAGRAATPAAQALAPPPPREPVSERQAESTALLPAAAPTGNGDTTDYSVGADNTVIVQAGGNPGTFRRLVQSQFQPRCAC